METSLSKQLLSLIDTLKPSLVEWKHQLNLFDCSFENALKPSLVEWKHVDVGLRLQDARLETFLGGMETDQRPRRRRG